MTTTSVLKSVASDVTESTPVLHFPADYRTALRRVAKAAERMYDSEVALHIARQSDNDGWVSAASSKLHEAIIEHSNAMQDRDAIIGTLANQLAA